MVDPVKDKTPPPKMRERRLLNVGFGVLNPLGESLSGKNFTPHNVSSLDAVRKSTVDHFSEHLLQKSGHFVGIVLRVDGSIKDGAVDPSHWSTSTSLLVKKGDETSIPDLLQVRVRIPELHSHLPVPEWLPHPEAGGTHADKAHEIINMYPSFVAASELLTQRGEPERGSLVWVDFQNRANYSGPTYYDKVQDITTFGTGEEEGSASEEDLTLSERLDEGDYVPEYVEGTTTVVLSRGHPIIKKVYRNEKGELNKSATYAPKNQRENRVRYFAYGDLKSTPGAKNNLVEVPENMRTKKLQVHTLLLDRLLALNELWAEYYEKNGLGSKTIPSGAPGAGKPYTNTLKVTSAYRKKEYSFAIGDPRINDLHCPGLKKYCRDARDPSKGIGGRKAMGYKSCRSARSAVAFMSPHMTGLCVDFGNNGISTNGKKKSGMRKSEAYKFLLNYAWLFGLYPYSAETWHFELQMPRESWFSGYEFASGLDSADRVRVAELEEGATSSPSEDATSMDKLIEVGGLKGEEWDWLAGKEFEYAVWVEESVDYYDTLTGPKVFTSSKDKFTVGYRDSIPGKEYFITSNLAIKYLNPPTS